MTDAELIEAIRRGDRAAFGCLVERYQRMVEAVAYSSTRDRALVDDAVQDTFVAAWRQLDRLRDVERLRPWLCGIARNLARKARRDRRREAPVPALVAPATPFEAASEHEREQLVATALAQLSRRYREPLVLFYYEQCSVKDVAAALAIREDAALQRLSRGRQQLGEALADQVEHTLERKRSRKALAACVLVLLPVGTAHAAAVPAWRVTLAARWRIPAAVLATATAALVMTLAVQRSEQIAARADAAAERPPDEQPSPELAAAAEHTRTPPRLPVSWSTNELVHGNIVVASTDPVETCARAARGLVYSVLARDDWHAVGDAVYFTPSPSVEREAETIAAKVGATCEGEPWPTPYVECEGTLTDIIDGNVACYPYDVDA
jgi:RNA polymerase sigma factor (sigma-70 family)